MPDSVNMKGMWMFLEYRRRKAGLALRAELGVYVARRRGSFRTRSVVKRRSWCFDRVLVSFGSPEIAQIFKGFFEAIF